SQNYNYVYTVMFLLYFVYALRHALTQSKVPQMEFHILAFLINGAAICFTIWIEGDSSSILGTWTYFGHGQAPSLWRLALPVGLILVLISVACYSRYYLHKYTPKFIGKYIQQLDFFGFYKLYAATAVITWVLVAVFHTVPFFISEND